MALKPTDEKDSFCLLPLVFDRLYRRLFLILCQDITLKSCVWFFFFCFFFCLSQSDTIADGSGPSLSDRLDPPTFPTLCRHYSVMRLFYKSLAIGLRLVGSVFAKTNRVHPYPIDSIRRLFLPSAKTLLQ